MRQSLAVAVLTALSTGIVSPASAAIVSVSSSGSGGIASNLTIGTAANPGDLLGFTADFTATAEIELDLTLSADTINTYYVGNPPDDTITNDTNAPFTSFYLYLVGLPAGSGFNSIVFNGPPWEGSVT